MTTSTLNDTDDSGPTRNPGGSIADRMRSLPWAGLSARTLERVPRELPLTPRTPPESQSLSFTPPQPTISPHTFIPTSSLGPPSPTSSSPNLPHPDLSEFAKAFPPIDGLEERMDESNGRLEGLRANSVPTVSDPLPTLVPSTSPPSLLEPSSEKPRLPVTSYICPRQLYDLMRQPGLKVLFLDVRSRSEFNQEHVKADAVVCIEPSVLSIETVTASSIEDSLAMGPRSEWTLFRNRDKFDVVVMYDAGSDSFGSLNSPLAQLFCAIYGTAFGEVLKRRISLLLGGSKAWKQDIGEAALTRTSKLTMSSGITEWLGRNLTETTLDVGGYLARGILKGDGNEHLFTGTGDLPLYPAPKKYPRNGATPPLSLAGPQIMEDDGEVAGASDRTFQDVTVSQDEHGSDCQCVIQ